MAAIGRREFVAQASAAVAAVALVRPGWAAAAPTQAELVAQMPKIRLGDLEVSRFLLGGNPFGGWAHQPGDLGNQMRQWHTAERIALVLDEAAAYGINAVVSPPEGWWVAAWKAYKAQGGKLAHWISQPMQGPATIANEIALSIDEGCSAVQIQGHKIEAQFEAGTLDNIAPWFEQVRKAKLPVGAGSHRPDVHPEIQKRGFPLDFYFQCFYNVAHGDTFRDEDRDKAVATIAQLDKPVIGYKILAAGRNRAADAFAFAKAHLRPKDGVCVGVYLRDKPNELRDDVTMFLS